MDAEKKAPLCEAVISYVPIGGEPDSAVCGKFLPEPVSTIPPDKNTDPFSLASKLTKRFEGIRICVLIPGTAFDMNGTRRGRGGGWYDRFLSSVPKEWIRIGVALPEWVSEKELKRESWDEPVDWLCVVSNAGTALIKTSGKRTDGEHTS